MGSGWDAVSELRLVSMAQQERSIGVCVSRVVYRWVRVGGYGHGDTGLHLSLVALTSEAVQELGGSSGISYFLKLKT